MATTDGRGRPELDAAARKDKYLKVGLDDLLAERLETRLEAKRRRHPGLKVTAAGYLRQALEEKIAREEAGPRS